LMHSHVFPGTIPAPYFSLRLRHSTDHGERS
jgi:hypothetical protein